MPPHSARLPLRVEAPALDQHEAVSVDHLVRRVRQQLAHLARSSARSPATARSRVVDYPLADRSTRSTVTSTASPASKSPSTSTIPTGSRLEPCSRSTRAAPSSTTSCPARRLRVLEPELEARRPCRLERRTGCRPAHRWPPRTSVPSRVPLQIDGRDPRLARHLCCRHLAPHPARAEGRGAIADLEAVELGEVVDLDDQLRLRVERRVGR